MGGRVRGRGDERSPLLERGVRYKGWCLSPVFFAYISRWRRVDGERAFQPKLRWGV